MWAENKKGQYADDNEVRQAFLDKWYPDNNRGLSKGQSLSEQSFVLYLYGAVHTVGRVSEKAVDALADNKLVNAWRKSVQKNSFQQRYNFLEEILSETVKARGTAAAVADFPRLNVSSPDEIAASVEYMNFNSKHYPVSTVAGLIRASAPAAGPGHPRQDLRA